ncbi:hypothetical protein EVAR_40544_1 [Eumeta japonica]|uniref:Uncharacterized protein n=1 Tax=Eumeta variegata TaxID=151549 RepID=A0A4C1XVC4_EUMVA|nr:hypothetical protein EVAR_40544_1 [Eumeta japonica]
MDSNTLYMPIILGVSLDRPGIPSSDRDFMAMRQSRSIPYNEPIEIRLRVQFSSALHLSQIKRIAYFVLTQVHAPAVSMLLISYLPSLFTYAPIDGLAATYKQAQCCREAP